MDGTDGAEHTRTRVRCFVTAGQATEAFRLIPDNLKAPAPAVVAIHDHGGFYYFAKEQFQCRYYDVPHSLTVPMQNDAIAWLERWLK